MKKVEIIVLGRDEFEIRSSALNLVSNGDLLSGILKFLLEADLDIHDIEVVVKTSEKSLMASKIAISTANTINYCNSGKIPSAQDIEALLPKLEDYKKYQG